MQRKSSKNTRGPNAKERDFQRWVKEHGCCYCGNPGPSIFDHSRGSCFKHNKVLIGHYFGTAKCYECDSVKTQGNHKWHFEKLGITESAAWLDIIKEYPVVIPEDVILSITDWGR